jgi:hypothetical protein
MTGVWWVPLLGLGLSAVGVYGWAFEDPFRHSHAQRDAPDRGPVGHTTTHS